MFNSFYILSNKISIIFTFCFRVSVVDVRTALPVSLLNTGHGYGQQCTTSNEKHRQKAGTRSHAKSLRMDRFPHLSVNRSAMTVWRLQVKERNVCLLRHYPPVQAVSPYSRHRFFLSRTEEPAKAGTCARDRRALQQFALNVHVKHSDLT